MAAGAPGLEVCPEKLRSAVAPRYSPLIGERECGEKQQGGGAPAHTRRRNTTSLDAEHHLHRPPAPEARMVTEKGRRGRIRGRLRWGPHDEDDAI